MHETLILQTITHIQNHVTKKVFVHSVGMSAWIQMVRMTHVCKPSIGKA
jgi:hypothetical protein